MNINNKIEIHRGVYFPNPKSSALSLNWTAGHTTEANSFAYLEVNDTHTAPVMEPVSQWTTTAVDLERIYETVAAGNLYITYQGSEEPYNHPDVTAGGVPSMANLMAPENLYVRLRDAYLSFDAEKLSDSGVLSGTLNADAVGKELVLWYDADDGGDPALKISVGQPTIDTGDKTSVIGIIAGVDTTSVVGTVLVTLVC